MNTKAAKWSAKLVDGRSFTLIVPNAADPREPSSIEFKKGVPVPVSNATKEYLEKNAVDEFTPHGGTRREETVTECKFDFELIDQPRKR